MIDQRRASRRYRVDLGGGWNHPFVVGCRTAGGYGQMPFASFDGLRTGFDAPELPPDLIRGRTDSKWIMTWLRRLVRGAPDLHQ